MREVTAAGFRAHMGWADTVVLEVSEGDARVLARRAIDLRPADGPVHPYHAAADCAPDARRGMIEAAVGAAEVAAIDALADLVGDGVETVGVLISPGVRHAPIERVLGSGRLLHMAEVTIYQQALRGAAAALRVPCLPVTYAQAEASHLWPAVAGLGKVVGPPWRKDHKFAAIAAWLAARADGSGTTPSARIPKPA